MTAGSEMLVEDGFPVLNSVSAQDAKNAGYILDADVRAIFPDVYASFLQ